MAMEIHEVEDKSGNKYRYKLYDGATFSMLVPGNVSDHLEKIGQIEYFPDDTIVLSYPKSGTNWTEEIVNMIRTGKAEYHERMNIFLEITDPESIVNAPSPRLYGCHLLMRHFPKSYLQKQRKIVYVYRNPKDVVVSMYNFFKNLNMVNYEGAWSDFLDLWLHKEIAHSWFDYTKDIAEFIKENPEYPILVVSYENMKKDLVKEVRRIAEFLAPGTSEELCQEIAKKCEFSAMNKAKNDNIPIAVQNVSKEGNHVFYRKGDVGDWKNWFTVAMNEVFDEEYKKRMQGFDLDVQFTIDCNCYDIHTF